MSNSELPEANLLIIQEQLEIAQQEMGALKMRRRESLRDFEYRVKAQSDKILSLKVAEQVQIQQIEEHARAVEAELLKKNS
jgi:hypothetical protein